MTREHLEAVREVQVEDANMAAKLAKHNGGSLIETAMKKRAARLSEVAAYIEAQISNDKQL